MDVSTGKTYDSIEAAREAGVSDSDLVQLTGEDDAGVPTVRVIKSGPFKGRTYRRTAAGQLVRVK